jgi:hypothetical protein
MERYRRIKSLDDLKTGTLIITIRETTIAVVEGIIDDYYIKVSSIVNGYWHITDGYRIGNSIYSLDFLMEEFRLLTKNI